MKDREAVARMKNLFVTTFIMVIFQIVPRWMMIRKAKV
jgi:hypothetical protein